jgi:uncharacterized protein (TIGR00369 family)
MVAPFGPEKKSMKGTKMKDNLRQRTVSWNDPAKLATVAIDMSGIDYLRALRDGIVDHPPISLLVDFKIVEVEEGMAVFQLIPAEYHLNPFGKVHGGVTSSVLDAATGCAVHSTLPKGVGYTSVDIKVNYVRPITLDNGPLRCEGKVIHAGAKLAIAEGRMIDSEGKLYAFGVSTIMIFR